jgi:serine/threonine-protein kinase RsbW
MVRPDPDNESTYCEICVRSTLQDAKAPESQILRDVEMFHFGDEATFAIKLALEEAMTNAVKHGNCNDASKSITVRYAVNEERVVIIVRDDGPGFTPEEIPDPTAPERISLPNGRGIMLMKAYMDEVHYRADGREVYLMKRNLNSSPPVKGQD